MLLQMPQLPKSGHRQRPASVHNDLVYWWCLASFHVATKSMHKNVAPCKILQGCFS